jgi:predicted ATPase/class 3 adenylate cyclase
LGAGQAKFATPMSQALALLLTDVVDSTQLAERLGDAAAAELSAAHDRVARDLLRKWRGREIDKTDGMLMLFDLAADALGFAMAYHAALAALPLPLKARAGLHVGAVILRSNHADDVALGAKPLEVEGIAKPVAARVMSLALGGQTLMTAEARAALGDTSLRVQSHGFWRIKGISDPVELFEAGDEHSPFAPPPDSAKVYRVVRRDDLWLPMREVMYCLPAERDIFVGRKEVLIELARRFDCGARLVSIVGVGGTGKTRLAARYGRMWLGDYPGGAWFCDLSSARSVDGIVQAAAHALGVPLGADDPVLQLGHAIASRGTCLLILDNFEQVTRHAEATVGRWLERAPEARCLVTTREVLGLPGERALALAPLDFAEGASLFVHRATEIRHDFEPDEDDRAAISRLVSLLDGLPLAIELAAARIRVMTPRTLVSRMDQRFRLLAASGGRRDRQATLRATFDWSWELLSDTEKSALAQLSVFEGGFTLEAVEGVLDLSACTGQRWAVDVLQSLVEKSLVRAVGATRFDLLVSVQEYAAEQLRSSNRFAGSGEVALRSAELAHCRYFAGLSALASTADGCVDIDNLVVASRRAVSLGDVALAAGMLENTWSAMDLRGPFRVGLELAEAALALPAGPADRARIGLVAGKAAFACGMQARAMSLFEQTLEMADRAGQAVAKAYAQCHLGTLLAESGLAGPARLHQSEALALATTSDDAELLCTVLNARGDYLMNHAGDLEQARSHFEHALMVARAARLTRWEGGLLGNLANIELELGRLAEAHDIGNAALATAQRIGDLKFAGNMLSNLGLSDLLAGKTHEAKAQFDRSLVIARSIGHRHLEGIVLCNLGLHFDALGSTEQAKAHFEQALEIAQELNDRRSQGQFLGYLGLVHARQRHFDLSHQCLERGETLLREVDDSISLALVLCQRSEAERMAERLDAAAEYLRQAEAMAQIDGTAVQSELGLALGRTRRNLAAASPSGLSTGC